MIRKAYWRYGFTLYHGFGHLIIVGMVPCLYRQAIIVHLLNFFHDLWC